MSDPSGPIVICGARGFVGRNLIQALRQTGETIRCGSRNPQQAQKEHPGEDWVHVDVMRPDTLDAAFEGADTIYYLVHQMRDSVDDLAKREAQSAANVLAAAEARGVRRIVYLGGPKPIGVTPSAHLQARLATGEILRSGSVSTIELRAAMIIGQGSESWLIVRDLAFRLPFMVLPRWVLNRSQPIWVDDVTEALVCARRHPITASRAWDLPGPETLSAKQILMRVAAARGQRPYSVGVPMLTPSLSSHWIRLVTRADYKIARKLVDGLTTDLVTAGPGFWSEMSRQPTPIDEAIRRAIAHEPPISKAERALERLASWIAKDRRLSAA